MFNYGTKLKLAKRLSCIYIKHVFRSIKSKEAAKDYLKLILERKDGIVKKCDYILQQLLEALKDDKPILRKNAITALKMVIDADSSILEKTFVYNAITQRCLDEKNAVRESVVRLLGAVMKKHPENVKTLVPLVLDRVAVLIY